MTLSRKIKGVTTKRKSKGRRSCLDEDPTEKGMTITQRKAYRGGKRRDVGPFLNLNHGNILGMLVIRDRLLRCA